MLFSIKNLKTFDFVRPTLSIFHRENGLFGQPKVQEAYNIIFFLIFNEKHQPKNDFCSYREVARWEIFLEQELRFWLDLDLDLKNILDGENIFGIE